MPDVGVSANDFDECQMDAQFLEATYADFFAKAVFGWIWRILRGTARASCIIFATFRPEPGSCRGLPKVFQRTLRVIWVPNLLSWFVSVMYVGLEL